MASALTSNMKNTALPVQKHWPLTAVDSLVVDHGSIPFLIGATMSHLLSAEFSRRKSICNSVIKPLTRVLSLGCGWAAVAVRERLRCHVLDELETREMSVCLLVPLTCALSNDSFPPLPILHHTVHHGMIPRQIEAPKHRSSQRLALSQK